MAGRKVKVTNLMKKIILSLILILSSSFFLSACGSKTKPKAEPTPTPRLIELSDAEKPYISLIPRNDGHELTMKISKIPKSIKNIEYELTYTAVDNNLEIEKGVGDTIKEISSSVERKILLGTESCTSGCKYKYDTGVNGGNITLTLVNQNGQVSTMQTPFSLRSTSDIKKTGNLDLPSENFSTKITAKTGEFYILIKNALGYSIFSTQGLINDLPFPSPSN